jgi:hypothetical protein
MTDRPWDVLTKHNPHLDSELLTPRECAAYRRCSVRKLERERSLGCGPPFVRDTGRIFYRRSDLDHFIAAHLCGGEDRGTKAQSQHQGRTILAADADVNGDMPQPRRCGRPRKNANATVAP